MKFNKFESVPNRYGHMVKKCCASCAHKCLNDFGQRNCLLTKKRVRASFVCGDWEMNEQLQTLGCEQGKVQRRAYQLTLLEVRASEGLAELRGEAITPKPLEDIQKEFEAENGSRFEDF